MKCPKCGYVGFEAADRCRHCGYEFSLMEPRAAEPPARDDLGPLRLAPFGAPAPGSEVDPDLARSATVPLVDLPLTGPGLPPATPSALFNESHPPPARTPLAVRRAAERPRSRATPQVIRRPRPELFDTGATAAAEPEAAADGSAPVTAPALARAASALLDVSLLAAIDIAVVYLTTQMAGVPVAAAATLPLVPLCAFVLGLNVAYLAVFTANGGQTLGKMAMGLRVVATDGPMTFGSALVRVVATIAGALAMGAGLIPVLWRADRRAVHDQIAHTRVVKVSA